MHPKVCNAQQFLTIFCQLRYHKAQALSFPPPSLIPLRNLIPRRRARTNGPMWRTPSGPVVDAYRLPPRSFLSLPLPPFPPLSPSPPPPPPARSLSIPPFPLAFFLPSSLLCGCPCLQFFYHRILYFASKIGMTAAGCGNTGLDAPAQARPGCMLALLHTSALALARTLARGCPPARPPAHQPTRPPPPFTAAAATHANAHTHIF